MPFHEILRHRTNALGFITVKSGRPDSVLQFFLGNFRVIFRGSQPLKEVLGDNVDSLIGALS